METRSLTKKTVQEGSSDSSDDDAELISNSSMSIDSDWQSDVSNANDENSMNVTAVDWAYATNHQFRWEDTDNYVPKKEEFRSTPGPRNGAENVVDVVGCFELFFTTQLVELIVHETNDYADRYLNLVPAEENANESVRKHQKRWKPVTEDEMYLTLSLFMLMGIIQKPSTKMYFSTDRLISTPSFSDTMTRDRFEFITKYLHFTNDGNIATYIGPRKLFKIFPILQYLEEKFRHMYLLDRNIAIDESLILWKDRPSFKQYLPLKSSKFGIKSYELCESTTGYLWSFIIYTGQDTEITSSITTTDTPKTAAIVLKLVEPLLDKGHVLWMNDFYNSLELAHFLKRRQTDCAGTLRINRKSIPNVVKEQNLKKGEAVAQHADHVMVMKWCDKKCVTMISTFHNAKMQTVQIRGKCVTKPACVLDYNKFMGGVDMKAQMVQPFLIDRKKSNKWYMKLFKKMLNVTILNSYIIYKQNTSSNMSQLEYRRKLIEGLIAKYKKACPARQPRSQHYSERLIGRHFMSRIPPTPKKPRPRKRCVVCYSHQKRQETAYVCKQCDVALCVDDCFEKYHTKERY